MEVEEVKIKNEYKKTVKIENVRAHNEALYNEINSVTGYPPMTVELMKITLRKQAESMSYRKCLVNKKRFFEECLRNV